MYVCTLFVERTNALVRIDVLEPTGLMRRDPVLQVSTTGPEGTVDVARQLFQPPTNGLSLGAAAVLQTLSGMVYSERGGGVVTYVHYNPDFDPAGFDELLSGINLAYQIVGLTTTRTVR